MTIYAVKNKHQGIRGYFSTYEKAQQWVAEKIDNSYGSAWSWDSWKIKEIVLDKLLEK